MHIRKFFPSSTRAFAVCVALSFAFATEAPAQLSSSAYRVLGQRDLQQNGLNMVQGFEFNTPGGVAIDSRSGRLHVYVSDTGNHRVLGWQDIRGYQNGDPPAVVLGQPTRQASAPLGIGARGFNSPIGLAVHPITGDLYVADFQNNRVLRFPDPFSNPARVEPDVLFGQSDFSRSVQTPSAGTLNRPRAVAFDAAGNLWVADSGNHRVVRYAAGSLDSPTPPDADIVIGQADFTAGAANAGGQLSAAGFDAPAGLAFDGQGSLYVSDLNNARVLKFAGPFVPGAFHTASVVLGQSNFTSRVAAGPGSATRIAGPAGIAVSGRDVYVSIPAENRVLVFSTDAASGAAASNVLGQSDFVTTSANTGSAPMASANSVSSPRDVKTDPEGGVLIADAGNHRVLWFNAGAKTAARVLGQTDFSSNGPNQIKPASLNAPVKIAIDYSRAPYALYVADANNHRVLCWKDSVRFRNGDPADFVIGQPDMRTAAANAGSVNSQTPSRTSLSSPTGLALDRASGALYVADAGNNRVLRYPRPVDQAGQILPDTVIGQSDFSSATSAAVGPASLRRPFAVALGPDGNLFVSDTGNNRVLEFRSGAGTGSSAIRVYGQPNLFSSAAPAVVSAQTLAAPQGLFVDSAHNLYVADTAANRVLIFPNTQAAPPAGMAAAFVIGQNRFDSAGTALLNAPYDVTVDSAADIYVADFNNNRVLAFSAVVFLPIAGATPSGVVGQRDLTSTAPNWNGGGSATPEGLFRPAGLFMDRQDTLYVSDIGNNRLLHFLKAAPVVNSATYQGGVAVAPGALAAAFGRDFTPESGTAAGAPWPSSLGKREIVFNDEITAPLYYMSGAQANFQVPWGIPLGSQRFAVRVAETGELIAGGRVAIATASPGLFTTAQNGQGQAAATNQDGRVNSSSNPAAKGSIVTLYGTGQGQVSPPVQDGMAAPSSPLSNTVTVPTSDARTCVTSQPSMCVAMGNGFGEVQFSGLAPGFVGLWQVNVRIPADAPSGNLPVRILINGIPSNTVSIAVR